MTKKKFTSEAEVEARLKEIQEQLAAHKRGESVEPEIETVNRNLSGILVRDNAGGLKIVERTKDLQTRIQIDLFLDYYEEECLDILAGKNSLIEPEALFKILAFFAGQTLTKDMNSAQEVEHLEMFESFKSILEVIENHKNYYSSQYL